jgi:hypothetical protein
MLTPQKSSFFFNQTRAGDDCHHERSTHAAGTLKRIPMKTLLTLLILAAVLPSAVQGGYCAPYITQTCVVDSRLESRWATDHFGRPYSYHVRVVTYRSYHSNGAITLFTRVHGA